MPEQVVDMECIAEAFTLERIERDLLSGSAHVFDDRALPTAFGPQLRLEKRIQRRPGIVSVVWRDKIAVVVAPIGPYRQIVSPYAEVGFVVHEEASRARERVVLAGHYLDQVLHCK